MKLIEKDEMSLIQREEDGYVNATALCKSAGKQFSDYSRMETTKAFISELSAVTGIPVTDSDAGNDGISSVRGIPRTGLIHSRQGGTPQEQGTYVHPKVAIHLAQWLSPKFAVFVTGVIFHWMNGEVVVKDTWSKYIGGFRSFGFFPRGWYKEMKRLYGQEATPPHVNNWIYENALGTGSVLELRRLKKASGRKADLYDFLTDEGAETVQKYVKELMKTAKGCASFAEFEAKLCAPALEASDDH